MGSLSRDMHNGGPVQTSERNTERSQLYCKTERLHAYIWRALLTLMAKVSTMMYTMSMYVQTIEIY